jgi:hypothetical protein
MQIPDIILRQNRESYHQNVTRFARNATRRASKEVAAYEVSKI